MATLSGSAIALLLLFSSVSGATYYFDDANGDDSRNLTQAQSPDTAWRTIDKFNQIQSQLAGSTFAFKKGGHFFGQMLPSSGNATNPTVITSYGDSTTPPLITGALTLSNSWTKVSGGLWKIAFNWTTERLFIDGQRATYARSPNIGSFARMEKLDTNNGKYFFDSTRTEADNYWVNATFRGRMSLWSTTTTKIATFSKGAFTTTTELYYPIVNFPYFLEGKLALVDSVNEWFYDIASKQLYLQVEESDSPNNHIIEAVVQSTGIMINSQRSYISISGLNFEKFFGQGVAAQNSNNRGINVSSCTFTNCGSFGIYLYNAFNSSVTNNIVSVTDNSGIYLGACGNMIVKDNQVSDISLYFGYNTNGAGITGGQLAYNLTISRNTVNNVGYVGIRYDGAGNVIDSNVVNNTMLMLADGGGVYGWGDATVNCTISNNIILNTGTAPGAGTPGLPPGYDWIDFSLYVDDHVTYLKVINNTVIGSYSYAIFLHGNQFVHVEGNTFIGSTDRGIMGFGNDDRNNSDHTIVNNIFVMDATGPNLPMVTADRSVTDIAKWERNFYCDRFKTATFTNMSVSVAQNQWVEFVEPTATFCHWPSSLAYVPIGDSLVAAINSSNGNGASNYGCWPSADPYNCSVSPIQSTPLCNGACVQATIAKTSPNGESQLTSKTFKLRNDTRMYQYFIDAASTALRKLSIMIRFAPSPFSFDFGVDSKTIYPNRITQLSGVLTLQPQYNISNTSTIDHIWAIHTASSVQGAYYFNNITLKPVVIQVMNNYTITWVVNYDRDQTRTISLPNGEEYIDIAGNLVTNKITLGPLRSIALLDKGFNASLVVNPSMTSTSSPSSPSSSGNDVTGGRITSGNGSGKGTESADVSSSGKIIFNIMVTIALVFIVFYN